MAKGKGTLPVDAEAGDSLIGAESNGDTSSQPQAANSLGVAHSGAHGTSCKVAPIYSVIIVSIIVRLR